MNPLIEATTDEKLIEHNTTEHGCECPALFYKSKVFTCPWTNDKICKHMYRFRLKTRLAAEEARFEKLMDTVFELYGDRARDAARKSMVPQRLRALRAELARKKPDPPPKLPRGKKAREQALAELDLEQARQEARVI
jgi:hypothetical protein